MKCWQENYGRHFLSRSSKNHGIEMKIKYLNHAKSRQLPGKDYKHFVYSTLNIKKHPLSTSKNLSDTIIVQTFDRKTLMKDPNKALMN